jgi:hypothetical protein
MPAPPTRPREYVDERAELSGAKRLGAEAAVIQRVGCRRRDITTARRDGRERGAAILWMRPAHGVIKLLEPVDEVGDAGGVNLGAGTDLAHGQ